MGLKLPLSPTQVERLFTSWQARWAEEIHCHLKFTQQMHFCCETSTVSTFVSVSSTLPRRESVKLSAPKRLVLPSFVGPKRQTQGQGRCRARRKQLQRISMRLPGNSPSQGQNLALAILFVPSSLDSGTFGPCMVLRCCGEETIAAYSRINDTNENYCSAGKLIDNGWDQPLGASRAPRPPRTAAPPHPPSTLPENGPSQGHNLALTVFLCQNLASTVWFAPESGLDCLVCARIWP